MNLSETAFSRRAKGAFDLRWFTPTVEVALCGHATLASGHVLSKPASWPPASRRISTPASGRLTARRREGRVEIDLPALPVEILHLAQGRLPGARPRDRRPGGGWPHRRHRRFPGAGRGEERGAGARAGARLQESCARSAPPAGSSPPSNDGARHAAADFISRYFAPAVGIDEDPVTGAGHCSLVPYWGAKLGKEAVLGFQASARGGLVWGRRSGDRVLLSGAAYTVLRGELLA